MVSQIGSGGTDVIGDEEQLGSIDVDPLEFEIDGEVFDRHRYCCWRFRFQPDFDLDFADGEGAIVTGKSVSDSTFILQRRRDFSMECWLFRTKRAATLKSRLKATLPVDVRVSGKFTGSSVQASPGKQKDSSKFQSGAKVKNSSFDLGKGKDTFKISGDVKIKGSNTIDLGKGKDKIVIGESVSVGKKGKLVLENMGSKDKVKVAGETFTKKDIENGDAPGFIELG